MRGQADLFLDYDAPPGPIETSPVNEIVIKARSRPTSGTSINLHRAMTSQEEWFRPGVLTGRAPGTGPDDPSKSVHPPFRGCALNTASSNDQEGPPC